MARELERRLVRGGLGPSALDWSDIIMRRTHYTTIKDSTGSFIKGWG